MFVLTCFWKNHNFATSTESSVVCAVLGNATLFHSHVTTLPYLASFTRVEMGGRILLAFFFTVETNTTLQSNNTQVKTSSITPQ